MSEKVISLRGTALPPTAPTPNPTVVAELERLLEAARAGELVGLAGTFLHKDHNVTYAYAGSVGGYGMIGGLACLKARLVARQEWDG
ncbi:hypothetical protein [Roseixanthobacter glucoisosaccharinicivorans]|uniref:hypothetical protein n=1 Tax=Roseixanthobacter glucoisosaccharinicivorans TaxID=3119923 RepID=UPI003726A877